MANEFMVRVLDDSDAIVASERKPLDLVSLVQWLGVQSLEADEGDVLEIITQVDGTGTPEGWPVTTPDGVWIVDTTALPGTAPNDANGKNNDLYLRRNGDVYQKVDGSWGAVLLSIKGATGAAGRGFNPLGAWSGATAYVVDDLVTSGGSTYRCILAHTNHVPPNATYWEVWASKGDAGAAGANGTNGQGVPAGGTAGQALVKIDGTDYNTQWASGADPGVPTTQTVALGANWTETPGGGSNLHYYKYGNRVYFASIRVTSTAGAATTIATLAAGYRPSLSIRIPVVILNNGSFATSVGMLDISSGGAITLFSSGDANISSPYVVYIGSCSFYIA